MQHIVNEKNVNVNYSEAIFNKCNFHFSLGKNRIFI